MADQFSEALAKSGGKFVVVDRTDFLQTLETDAQLAQVLSKVGYPEASPIGYTTPRCDYCPDPMYTRAARHRHIQGVVVLRVVIGPDGRAHDIVVKKKLGLGLTEEAVKAVGKWKFAPAIGPNGKPAAVHMMIEISFNLD